MNELTQLRQGALSSDHDADIADALMEASNLRVDARLRRGRGAGINPSGRFESERRQRFDDGWELEEEPAALRTEVQPEKPRSIIARNTSPDLPFDRSINPYRGCEHGCIYCFARPTHSYMGLSPGLDFESKLFAKPDAARLLEREIGRADYKVRTIAIGTNTDPYQPIEKEWRIMRQCLEVLAKANHPVAITTKSALVLRDLDILGEMAGKGLVQLGISITTLDGSLARAMEPRAATPKRRLHVVDMLAKSGVPVSVMVAPVIPALTDHEIETILDAASEAGATSASYVLLRLPLEVSPLFRDWLLQHYPGRYRHVMSLIRSMRGGKDYDADFSKRMKGAGPYAWQIARRFEMASKRLGLTRRNMADLRDDLFIRPAGGGIQLSLL